MVIKSAYGFALAAALSVLTLPALAQDNDTDAISRGRAVATAGDCSACHQDHRPGGSAFGGGLEIVSPVGSIYASNITPDKQHGIGAWTFEQFRDAMTKGESPTKGMLYPAMPYTAYTNMSDDDLHALYTYLMTGVQPSDHEPPVTELPFPFVRQAMHAWNLLFLHTAGSAGATAPAGSVARGQYVAQALEHCSTCHTPRNDFFAENTSKLLSGAQVGSWFAPNITSDKTGIGAWSDEELTQFLTQGHNDHASAGGDMGLAVQRSLSRLPPEDIRALVAYLRSLPPVSTPHAAGRAHAPAPVDVAAVEPQQHFDIATLANGSSRDGAQLYQSACAACHAANGTGTVDKTHPDLASNSTVLLASPNNLILTIAEGVHRTVNGQKTAMPGFSADLNNAQIAALATYVRQTIGGLASSPAITVEDVVRVRGGDVQQNWLTHYAKPLAIVGLIVLAIIVLLIGSRLKRRKVIPN
ncbi:c-type cytochrome [Pseudomonas sp. dw_358]|uniref:c-type cytochrome n=1 Tax=Pseudomonas sp. dw_358 TaxID=2720083 RepID=UPI001BD32F77|nr:c-type cytochrome [Pseudomonas sp. dw_358]